MPRRLKLNAIWKVVWRAALDWLNHDAFAQAAAISFFALFSLAPLLVIAVAIAGAVFGQNEARAEIIAQFTDLLGEEGGKFIGTIIDNARTSEQGIWATTIGIGTLVVAASGAFVQLKAALNQVWEVKPKPGLGIAKFFMTRLASFGLALGVAFLLILSLTISAALAAIGKWSSEVLPHHEVPLQIANFTLGFLVIAILFAAMYKALPDAQIGWRETIIGAIITSALFSIGKHFIGLYLGRSSPGSVYGAAGSLAIVLFWIYFSSLVMLLGAEITHQHALSLGKKNPPKPDAEECPDPKRELTRVSREAAEAKARLARGRE